MVAETRGRSDETTITADLMVPELLRAHPGARAVLDRYGLRGCGGRLGPSESLGFFARVHGVEEGRLLRELQDTVARGGRPDAPPADPSARVADTIYRRYFTAGIVLALTAGATWGAWLLWRIGLSGTYLINPIHQVNAHGMAQISGWVGLFIMGFAYQAFPRLWHTSLAAPRLAAWAFAAMVGGIFVQALGMILAGSWPLAVPAAVLGGALQVAAVATFAGQILASFRRSTARVEPYVGFIAAALGWFVAAALFNVWHTWATLTAPDAETLTWHVATYQAPLRDLQIHGLALFMILGVSTRMVPALFGVRPVGERRAWWALGVLTLAVLGEIALFVTYRWTGNHALAAALIVPWVMLGVGAGMIALPWRLWRPFPERDRVGKFVRAAYGWLAISLVMLLALPVYQAASGLPFSHAYYGAIRHAITVGFISLMIMGFAAKVVPTLTGADPRRLGSLWGPFLLVNVGCFLRVTTQMMTDWLDAAYAIIGLSGTLEVAGLAWWGIGLLVLIRRARREEAGDDRPIGEAPERIEAEHHPADVLGWFPETAGVFDRFGFTALRSPVLRRTVGRRTTLAQAARLRGVEAAVLVEALNDAIAREPQSPCHPDELVQIG